MAAKYTAFDCSGSNDDLVIDEPSIEECATNLSRRMSREWPNPKIVSFQGDPETEEEDEMITSSKSSDHLVLDVQEMREVVSESEGTDGNLVEPVLKNKFHDKGRRLSKRTATKIVQLSLDDTGNWSVPPTKSIKSGMRNKFGIPSMEYIRKTRNEPDFCMKAVVLLMFVTIISTIVTVTIMYKKQQVLISKDAQIFFWDTQREFDLLSPDGKLIFKGHYAENVPDDLSPSRCLSIDKDGLLNEICRDWKHRAHLEINYVSKEFGVSCYHVHWQGHADGTVLRDCFDLGDAFWYGMGQVTGSPWPLNGGSLEKSAFVTGHDLKSYPFGSIIKRYWLSSSGVAIRVPLNVPLFVEFNSTRLNPRGDGRLCFESATSKYPYDAVDNIQPHLDYSICTGSDMLTVHREMSKAWIKKSNEQASEILSHAAFLAHQIWATNARSLSVMSQEAVVDFANSILDYGLEPGFILLDRRWENKIGDLEVNVTSFPTASNMFTVLKNKGFKVLLTVSPFVDISSDILAEASHDHRIIDDPHLDVPLLTRCYGGRSSKMCALMDMMNASTREWFRKSIKTKIIAPYHVDGFLFKGAQVSLMPHHIHSFQHNIINPDYFQMYFKNVARHMSRLVGMNTAVGVQRLNAFYQLLPVTSSWTSLKSIIPTVLNLGIIGYSAVNIGSVGGELGETAPVDNVPFNRELYIRWLQLSMFMPVLQFGSPPGSETNDIEIIKLNKRLLKIRSDIVLPALLRGLEESKDSGWAIIRPLFFIETNSDEETYKITDQFAVCEDIVVAPVLEDGVRQRDIYLPQGWWRDELLSQQIRGGKWLRNYTVPLDRVPFFTKVTI